MKNKENKNLSKQIGETVKRQGQLPPIFFIEKPNKKQIDKNLFFEIFNDDEKSHHYVEIANNPNYLYWDNFKRKVLEDKKYSPEGIWYTVRQIRNFSSIVTPVKTEQNRPFRWVRLPSTDELLHKIDMFAGGRLFHNNLKLTASSRQTYLNRGIIEEAIASSQLEGAHTTRKAAKEMLVERREPRNESEQMILNNYKTMNAINDNFKDEELSLEMLFELHAMLTEKTLDKKEQYRLRKDSDEIVVQGQIGTEEYITHIPPTELFVESTIKELVKYANDKDEKEFTHPIIKAVILHFWIGYLHPFVDGNGRLARALFYWYLLKKDYWTFMYLPISTIIKKAPLQYAMAYIYSEQDGLDLTYFYDFHMKKIMQAIKEFESYLDEKITENHLIEDSISKKFELNDRQKQLIYYLISDNDPSVSASSHMTLHNVSRQTAFKDLKNLEEMGIIKPRRSGKYIKYLPSAKLLKETDDILGN